VWSRRPKQADHKGQRRKGYDKGYQQDHAAFDSFFFLGVFQRIDLHRGHSRTSGIRGTHS
jgi:hypothetical protein